MANTTNFGWETPDDTDLVKDGASAIRTLGSAIDTSLVDLKGGTTGQVLSKASNTDMDFTWVAQDDSNAIQNALLTTTGDTIYASGASTPARLGIGSTGQVLTVSAGGIPSWATVSGGAYTLLSTTALSGTSTTVSSINQNYRHLYIRVYDAVFNTGGQDIYIRPNSNDNAYFGRISSSGTTVGQYQGTPIRTGFNQDNTGGGSEFELTIFNYTSSQRKVFTYNAIWITSGSYGGGGYGGGLGSSSAITSINVMGSANYAFTGGSIQIYGVN